jgi:hypothetical protein
MSVLVCSLQGRFGNQVMQYLLCRAFAQAYGLELRMDPWIGERIFQIDHPRPNDWERPGAVHELPRVNEHSIFERDRHEPFFRGREFRGYAQMQQCMIYTKRQAQAWLKLRPEIETACAHAVLASPMSSGAVVCHRRVGDYVGYGYPVVSHHAYERACAEFGLDLDEAVFLSEENPIPHAGFLPDELSFMPDFYRMMVAKTLLRANSSFSWLAALLGDGLVLSPIVEGLEGGKEHNCAFVAGNHPRFAPHLDFVTDLHVAP